MKNFDNMKTFTIKKIALGIMMPLCVLASCDYLDVMPPEQADVDDTMKTAENAVGFLYSCYMAVKSSNPITYTAYEWSTDESVDPPLWNGNNQKAAWNLWSADNAAGHWDALYNYNGHCHMFLKLLAENDPRGATEEDKARWKAEAEFLKAYYHFKLLSMYGPIPIMDQRPPQSTPAKDLAGRSHYDYVVDYIVDKLDESAKVLPAFCTADEWGRGTSTVCKAIKARTLLYAASDLWNGKFPYPDWKNINYETPGYGKELVSNTYSREKWERALEANLDALTFAENEGQRKLMDLETAQKLMESQKLPLPYVPNTNIKDPKDIEFLERVLLMRYIMNTYESDGNNETIWATFADDKDYTSFASWPKRVAYRNNSWQDGWCATSPTLYTVEHFYTRNGKLPEKDNEFALKDEWFTSANTDRPEIINLNVNREPRFYAWLSFDGDDYSSLITGGKPLRVNLRDGQKQGYNPELFNRDYSVTGYFSKKFTQPNIQCSTSSASDNRKNYPRVLFRLAELYLNVAECYAALDDVTNSLKYLNPIRKRAGIPELTKEEVASSGMSIMEWVRNERFIELWSEGQRYYDVRRWMTAPTQLRANAREGLNMTETVNPTFTQLNKRVTIDQQFRWEKRMYLWPIKASEIYSDPQLMQAPEY